MFSIIVPSYNRKEEIPALLESLTKQTTYNFDVVIVDDCSKEPVEVTQSYPFAVKVIRNETNHYRHFLPRYYDFLRHLDWFRYE